jgi:MoaA/NifB/PqqE/SkfB family radical SAM enzyme
MSEAMACAPSSKPKAANLYLSLMDQRARINRPLSGHFEITYRCNHTCPYCYNAIDPRLRELNTEEALRVVNMMADFGTLYITLTGGEPLLRKDFFVLAEEAKRRHMAVRIYTNGFLIDGAMADRIRKLAPLEVGISLHGADAATHDRETRVRGSLERLVAGVRHLRQRGLKVLLKTPITANNQNQLREMKKLAESLDTPIIFDPVITARDDGNRDPLRYGATEEFLRRWFSEEFVDVRTDPKPWRRALEKEESNCKVGSGTYAIDPYGYIYPCVAWRRRLANVRDVESLAQVWDTSGELQEVLDISRRIPRETLQKHEAGAYAVFCPGAAEREAGSPLKFYPAADLQARIRKEKYGPLLQIRAQQPVGAGS